MKRIPDARGVDRALAATKKAVKSALKGLNQSAAQQMARGDYATAEALAARGRAIQQFQSELDSLHERWRELRRGDAAEGSKKDATPMWSYYQPILRALADRGGAARRADLEPAVERLMSRAFQPSDRDPLARGLQRWQVMIRRARKHLVAEGWIEAGAGMEWRITESGMQAAKRPLELGSPGSPKQVNAND